MADFEIDFLPNIWRHPETDVSILGEDMPWELIPARTNRETIKP